jgi:hypothetical protein
MNDSYRILCNTCIPFYSPYILHSLPPSLAFALLSLLPSLLPYPSSHLSPPSFPIPTTQEVDMTNLIAMRNKHKEEFEKSHGVKLGFMSAFVRVRITVIDRNPL